MFAFILEKYHIAIFQYIALTSLSIVHKDLFDIDRTSGTLRNTKDLLGHAQDIPYKLEVVASDNGAPPLMAAVIVNVFISDLQGNDDVPRILAPAVDGQSFSLPEVSLNI